MNDYDSPEWLGGNPINSDKEILDDYNDVHYFFDTNTFDQTKANNILKKYNYAPSDNEKIVKRNMRDFKRKVDNDMGLSWRRIKMFDVCKLNRFLK